MRCSYQPAYGYKTQSVMWGESLREHLSLHCNSFSAARTDTNLSNQFCMMWVTCNKQPEGRDPMTWNKAKGQLVVPCPSASTLMLLCIKCNAATTTVSFLTHAWTHGCNTSRIHEWMLNNRLRECISLSFVSLQQGKAVRALEQPPGTPRTRTPLIPH